MDNLKSPEYGLLREKFYANQKIFEKEEKNLKENIFREENKILKTYEQEIKNEFLDIWKKYGNLEYTFCNMEINLDPFNCRNHASVMILKTPKEILDLELIALNFPKEKREHYKLENEKEYKIVADKMKEELRELKLYLRNSEVGQIRDFQEKFNIISFDPRYFEK